jgi:hypothetical protein
MLQARSEPIFLSSLSIISCPDIPDRQRIAVVLQLERSEEVSFPFT